MYQRKYFFTKNEVRRWRCIEFFKKENSVSQSAERIAAFQCIVSHLISKQQPIV